MKENTEQKMIQCLIENKLIKSHLCGVNFVLILSAKSDFNMQFTKNLHVCFSSIL